MIAAAARPGEALNARWSEVDLKKKLWTVPVAKMKSAREHIVPLSSIALEVLERQAGIRVSDAVFPGMGGGSLSYTSFVKAPQKAGIDAGSAHGWRSVFRDACGDKLHVDRDVAEAALAHSLGKVESSYRRLTAVERRRPVMERYARWLLDEAAGAVVALKRG
jgi:integrase